MYHPYIESATALSDNSDPCGVSTFLCVSVATHVTVRGVRVITIKCHIRFGSARGQAGTETAC